MLRTQLNAVTAVLTGGLRSCQLCLDNSPQQGGCDDTLAKTAASLPVQRFCSLDDRHVDRTGDTRARRPARLHLDLGRVRVTGADLQANLVLDSYCGFINTRATGCRDGGFRTPTP